MNLQPPVDQKVLQGNLYAEIIGELDLNKDQTLKRQKILSAIETKIYEGRRKIFSFIHGYHPLARIDVTDIAPIGTLLDSFGVVENLDLLIHSQGGDGTIAEKIVEMCRDHCKNEFRVIIPNRAKSAATLIALGSDKIIGGYCSELGPIDAQFLIEVSKLIQAISAQSFIDARDKLLDNLKIAKNMKEPIEGYLQQLASLNIPFIEECERAMEFSKDLTKKFLSKFMFKKKFPDLTQAELENKADEVAKKLSSRELYPSHGKLIKLNAAKTDLNLETEELKIDDPLWKLIWEYYVRAEISFMISTKPNFAKVKLLETSHHSLVNEAPIPIQPMLQT